MFNFKFLNAKLNQEIDWTENYIKQRNELIDELNTKLFDAQEEIRRLEDERESFQNILDDEVRDAPIVIDWVGMDVVSIERYINEDGFPMTVVTYKDYQGELQEWFYHCSEQWHTQLAFEFGKYLLKRK